MSNDDREPLNWTTGSESYLATELYLFVSNEYVDKAKILSSVGAHSELRRLVKGLKAASKIIRSYTNECPVEAGESVSWETEHGKCFECGAEQEGNPNMDVKDDCWFQHIVENADKYLSE